MKGKDLQKAVIDLARVKGYRVAHFQSVLATTPNDPTPRWRTPFSADGKGFPDLILAKKDRLLAIEIKGDGDRLRSDQVDWLKTLASAGAGTMVVTPRAWHAGDVERFLDS